MAVAVFDTIGPEYVRSTCQNIEHKVEAIRRGIYLVSRIRDRGRDVFYNHVHETSRWPKKLIQNCLQQWPDVHFEHDRLQLDSQRFQSLPKVVRLFTDNLAVQLVQRLDDEVNKCSILFKVYLLAGKLSPLGIEEDISP